MSVEELGRLEGFRVGARGPVFVCVFEETATIERLQLLEALQTSFVLEHPRTFSVNVVIGKRVKGPPAEVRALSSRLQKQFDGSTVASATVLEVSGLGAVIARGFLAALALASPGSKPTEVFKTVSQAVEWIATLPGGADAIGDVPTACAQLSDFVAALRPR